NGELPHTDREGAQQSKRGIAQNGQHQGTHAAKLISDRPPEKRKSPADQKQSEQQAAVIANVSFGSCDPGARQQFAQRWHQHQRIDNGIHAVESPTSPRRPEAAYLIARQRCGSLGVAGLTLTRLTLIGWIRERSHIHRSCNPGSSLLSGPSSILRSVSGSQVKPLNQCSIRQ